MKRSFATALGLMLLVGVSAACSQFSTTPVAITSTESFVAGCQKVGDVAASAKTPDVDVNIDLTDAARAKGANYILVPAQGARSGVAYKCGTPSVAAR